MMKTFLLILGLAILAMAAASPLLATPPAETVEGRFVIPASQNRVYLGSGDKAIVTLGAREGLIKGDVLQIGAASEHGFTPKIGRCVVLEVRNDSSICEIVKAKAEVGAGYRAIADRLAPGDERIAPHAFHLLFLSVEPYSTEKAVRIYIHHIFDEKNDVTELSRRIRGEIRRLFAQKKRVTLREPSVEKGAKFYPGTYRKYTGLVEGLMDKEGIDVIITGSYKVEGGVAKVSLLKLDRTGGEETISFALTLSNPDEARQAASVVIPYDSVEKMDYVPLRIVTKELQYVPVKDEKKAITALESAQDAFREYEMKRAIYNIVSPVAVDVVLDNEKVGLSASEAVVPVTKGLHRLSVAFKRGYFLNTREIPIVTSNQEIRKEILVDVARDGNIVVEITMNPTPKAEGVQFKVFREIQKERSAVKGIQRVEAGRLIDFYKD
jgi:hypothetical protein